MAKEEQQAANGTVLVAEVRVQLVSGEWFELLPFEDENDVKAKVSDLLTEWAKSGFLVRGADIVPWHQVRRLEATRVEELTRGDAALRRKEWETKETARLQQSFWMTKKARETKEEGESGKSQSRAA